jgi:hypothetical protein
MRQRKTILIVLFIIVASIFTFTDTHFAVDKTSMDVEGSEFYCGAKSERMKTYSKIAIVTPSCGIFTRALQREIALELKNRLEKEAIVYDVTRHTKSYTAKSPTVNIYPNEQAAIADKPEFLIFVKPKSFRRLPLSFLYQSWDFEVQVDCGPPGCKEGSPLVNISTSTEWKKEPYLSYSSSTKARVNGRMFGLFGSSYLRSTIAEKVANKVAGNITSTIREQVEKHQNGTDGEPRYKPESESKKMNVQSHTKREVNSQGN